jgi:hypothetical protein
MSGFSRQMLGHQYLYLPWAQLNPKHELAPKLATLLASQHGATLTVVAPTLSAAPDALSRYDAITERSSRRVPEGGVVLVYAPTRGLEPKFTRLESSVMLLVEWPTVSYAGWAKLVGAYNVATRARMTAGLTQKGINALEGVMFHGYKGWHDAMAVRATTQCLHELQDIGQYDREVVLAYARRERGEERIKRLYPLLDDFDRNRASV